MNSTKVPDGAVPVGRFHWDGRRRAFVAEVSELPPGTTGPVVTIYNPTTGRCAIFRCVGTDRDRDGDVAGWRYTCAPLDIRLTIIND